MSLKPQTQDELKKLALTENEICMIQYKNKDYYNGEETLEVGQGSVVINEDGNIYCNVTDPYGMEKLMMQFRIIGRSKKVYK
jgi:hypothetical protein